MQIWPNRISRKFTYAVPCLDSFNLAPYELLDPLLATQQEEVVVNNLAESLCRILRLAVS